LSGWPYLGQISEIFQGGWLKKLNCFFGLLLAWIEVGWL